MSVATYKATVVNGQIKLDDDVRLPENGKVYVVVPDGKDSCKFHIRSPRLASRSQAAMFAMEVTEEPADDGV